MIETDQPATDIIPTIVISNDEETEDDDDEQINVIVALPSEKFQEVDGGAALYDGGLMARYCFRTLNKYPIIYGCNRYSFGTHHVRFQIEKRGDLRSFFGIISSSHRVSRVISVETDNQSLYGWWGVNILVQNGKVKRNKERNEVEKNDQLTLTLKCDQQQIQLEHHRTRRVLELSIDVLTCPFPWRIVVELPSYADCVRIVQ